MFKRSAFCASVLFLFSLVFCSIFWKLKFVHLENALFVFFFVCNIKKKQEVLTRFKEKFGLLIFLLIDKLYKVNDSLCVFTFVACIIIALRFSAIKSLFLYHSICISMSLLTFTHVFFPILISEHFILFDECNTRVEVYYSLFFIRYILFVAHVLKGIIIL